RIRTRCACARTRWTARRRRSHARAPRTHECQCRRRRRRRTRGHGTREPAMKTYSDLKALFINTTLKPAPQHSHTASLMKYAEGIMRGEGVEVAHVRALDYMLAPGVQPDMTEHGFEQDEWPALYDRVRSADILVIGTPIWLG